MQSGIPALIEKAMVIAYNTYKKLIGHGIELSLLELSGYPLIERIYIFGKDVSLKEIISKFLLHKDKIIIIGTIIECELSRSIGEKLLIPNHAYFVDKIEEFDNTLFLTLFCVHSNEKPKKTKCRKINLINKGRNDRRITYRIEQIYPFIDSIFISSAIQQTAECHPICYSFYCYEVLKKLLIFTRDSFYLTFYLTNFSYKMINKDSLSNGLTIRIIEQKTKDEDEEIIIENFEMLSVVKGNPYSFFVGNHKIRNNQRGMLIKIFSKNIGEIDCCFNAFEGTVLISPFGKVEIKKIGMKRNHKK